MHRSTWTDYPVSTEGWDEELHTCRDIQLIFIECLLCPYSYYKSSSKLVEDPLVTWNNCISHMSSQRESQVWKIKKVSSAVLPRGQMCWHIFLLWEELERFVRKGLPSTEQPRITGGGFLPVVPVSSQRPQRNNSHASKARTEPGRQQEGGWLFCDIQNSI